MHSSTLNLQFSKSWFSTKYKFRGLKVPQRHFLTTSKWKGLQKYEKEIYVRFHYRLRKPIKYREGEGRIGPLPMKLGLRKTSHFTFYLHSFYGEWLHITFKTFFLSQNDHKDLKLKKILTKNVYVSFPSKTIFIPQPL